MINPTIVDRANYMYIRGMRTNYPNWTKVEKKDHDGTQRNITPQYYSVNGRICRSAEKRATGLV